MKQMMLLSAARPLHTFLFSAVRNEPVDELIYVCQPR